MLTSIHHESPCKLLHRSWPLKFLETRHFCRRAENEPYIGWLKEYEQVWDDGYSSGHDEESENAEGSEDDEEPENTEDSTEVAVYRRKSLARLFMEGLTGCEECLPYHNQIEVVAAFGEQVVDTDTEKQRAILLDYRRRSPTREERRLLHHDALTPKQLREQLSKPRFIINSERGHSADGEEMDIERRILFLPDLVPLTMEAVFATAPRTHALALKNFFYEHLTGKSSIGATIRSCGFKFFTFNLHIPFYVLKESKLLIQDTRRGHDGKPLRRSWNLPFLSGCRTETSSALPQCLYEAQISVTITGIDHRVWTAYGAFDDYFESKNSVHIYNQTTLRSQVDPIASDQLFAHSISTPREYFFRVYQIRINQVRREWGKILDKLQGNIHESREWASFPLDFDDARKRKDVLEFSAWSKFMVEVFRALTSRLGDTLDAWDRFQHSEIGYFLFDDDNPTTSSFLKDSVASVSTVFLELKDILKKLRRLEEELIQDSPQEFNAQYTHGNRESSKKKMGVTLFKFSLM